MAAEVVRPLAACAPWLGTAAARVERGRQQGMVMVGSPGGCRQRRPGGRASKAKSGDAGDGPCWTAVSLFVGDDPVDAILVEPTSRELGRDRRGRQDPPAGERPGGPGAPEPCRARKTAVTAIPAV